MKTIYVLFHDKDKTKKLKIFDSKNEAEFKKYNEQGYGVYFSVNLFKEHRREEECLKLRYVYADLDVAKQGDGKTQEEIDTLKNDVYEALQTTMAPTLIIDTKNGLQPLWELTDGTVDRMDEYKNIIRGIIDWSRNFGCAGDAVQDAARILRMPGYFHQKGEPYLCQAIGKTERKFTLDELKKVFWHEEVKQEVVPRQTYNLTLTDQAIERIDFQELIVRAFAGVGRTASFNDNQELVLDGRKTGTFQGRKDGGAYLASSSHEPFKGNKITAVADILQITNKEARKWIIDQYHLDFETLGRKEKIASQLQTVKKEENNFGIEKREKRYTWGTPKVDRSIVILKRGNLVVIGAKRSMGKTTFTFDMACKNAKLGHRVLYISLEMEKSEIIESMSRSFAGITVEEEYDYEIPAEKMAKMQKKAKEILDIENLNFAGIRRGDGIVFDTVKELINSNPCDLVFIDNLDLISSDEKEDEYVKQKRIITSLMSLTSEKNIPIVLIHHYRKGNKQNSGMDELAGSGKIADGADIIINLSRSSVEEVAANGIQFPDSRKTVLWVQKGRGYTDKVEEIYYVGGTFYDRGDIPPNLYHMGEVDNLMIHRK